MIPWELLDRAPVPGDRVELTLHRRGEEYSIRVDGQELMNSRSHGSEDALGRVACQELGPRQGPVVLVGGLGLGFTARAVLEHAPDARVIVAEIVPAVVRWNRELCGHLAGQPLKDPRLSVETVDVVAAIARARDDYDAILLDVDNGPEAMTHGENRQLYASAGLAACRRALRSGGVLAIWSPVRNARFVKALARAGFEAREIAVSARGGGRGGRHTIWVARVRAG